MAKITDVKLLGMWSSPFVMRAQIALHLKSVQYEHLEENIASKSDLLLRSNPIHKKLPVLIHGDKPVCESLNIVEYIDESWPSNPSILPSDPYDRAIARSLAVFIDDHWFPSLNQMVAAQEQKGKEEAKGKVEEAMLLLEGAFRKCSKGRTFFGGDQIGYLDIVLGSWLAVLSVMEKLGGINLLQEDKIPCLFKWAGKFESDDAVKRYIPDADKLIEFVKKRFNKN